MFGYVTTLILDKAGRIVIPAKVRNEMGLKEGEPLILEFDGSQITIKKGDKNE